MKLYEITEEHKKALDQLNEMMEQGQIDQQAVADSMAAIVGEFEAKAVSCVAYLKNIQAESEALTNAIRELQAKKKARDNSIESFKDYLRMNMEACGIKKIDSPLFSATLGKPSKQVVIDDPDMVPEKFKKTAVTIDKRAINKALDEGMIDGVSVVDGKSKLIIK